jgi:hypothetical protein
MPRWAAVAAISGSSLPRGSGAQSPSFGFRLWGLGFRV